MLKLYLLTQHRYVLIRWCSYTNSPSAQATHTTDYMSSSQGKLYLVQAYKNMLKHIPVVSCLQSRRGLYLLQSNDLLMYSLRFKDLDATEPSGERTLLPVTLTSISTVLGTFTIILFQVLLEELFKSLRNIVL